MTETPKNWMYTFRFDNVDPKTKKSLISQYVVLFGTIEETKAFMRKRFATIGGHRYEATPENIKKALDMGWKEVKA